jgi:hypothetical protein
MVTASRDSEQDVDDAERSDLERPGVRAIAVTVRSLRRR